MAVTQLADIIQPAEFTNYITEHSLVSTALFLSGVALENGEMAVQLSAGAQSFTVPCWNDLADTEANMAMMIRPISALLRSFQRPSKLSASLF